MAPRLSRCSSAPEPSRISSVPEPSRISSALTASSAFPDAETAKVSPTWKSVSSRSSSRPSAVMFPYAGTCPEKDASVSNCRAASGRVIRTSVSGITVSDPFVMVKRTWNSPGVSSLQMKSGDTKTSPCGSTSSAFDAVADTAGAANALPQNSCAASSTAESKYLVFMAASFRSQCHGFQSQPVIPVIPREVLDLSFHRESILRKQHFPGLPV